MKIVELLVEQEPWFNKKHRISCNKITHLSIDNGAVHLGHIVKSASGRWNKENGFWELPYREVVALGIDNRIINDYTIFRMKIKKMKKECLSIVKYEMN